jgi:hypothetical protein
LLAIAPQTSPAQDAGPQVMIRIEQIETRPDGEENRLSAPRVITQPGQEATVSVSDAVTYLQFGVKPTWQDGKIQLDCSYEDGKVNLPPGSQPVETKSAWPAARAPRPTRAKFTQDRTFPQKPRGSKLFPDNLILTGIARLPGKPARISLRDINAEVEFWINLGSARRDIHFVSIDFTKKDPVALLKFGEQFAEVRRSTPVLKPVQPPLKTARTKFRFTDLVKPGEAVVFDIGTSRNGHPQRLRVTASGLDDAQLNAIKKKAKPLIPK